MEYFDLHCDTITACEKQKRPLQKNNLHIDLQRGAALDNYVQCFAVFIEDARPREQAFSFFERVVERLHDECEMHKEQMKLCGKPGDLTAAQQQRKIAAVLTVENGALLAGKLERLDRMASLGVKMMTLTWNGENEIGAGAGTNVKTGLTPFGRAVLPKMESLGIVADISHASDRLFEDTAAMAKKPLVASHSNARKICPHRRNLTDEQFAFIRDGQGLVGLNFYKAFLNKEPDCADSSDILRHAEHFLSLGGEDVLAIGSDFDGAAMPAGISGLESIESLYELFLKHNYNETLVQKIFFKNASDFFIRNNLL